MPSTNGGIYVELINYKAFIDNVDGLKEGVKQLNTELKNFATSVDEFDKKLGSAFQSLPKTAAAAGKSIQENLIDVLSVISKSDVKKSVQGFADAGSELGSAIESIGKAFNNFKVNTNKLASFEKVFQSLARAMVAFNTVRNVGALPEITAFVGQLPEIFAQLSSLNRYLSIIPNNYFTQLGRVIIGLDNITQPLARALSAFDQIKVHPGHIVDSLDGLIKIIQKLGNINVKGGDTQINFLRGYFITLLGIAPIISRLAGALAPLSGFNASTFTALGDFLPGLLKFIRDFDDFAKQSGSKTSWIKAIAIWAGFNTGSLKQMVNTFKALADGLKKFNDVKVLGSGKDFGDLALGLKRLVEAAIQLQDLAQLAIFNKKTVTKNIEAAFTALAHGLGVFANTKIPDASQLSQVARFSKEIAKLVDSLKDLDANKITRAFDAVGKLLAERGERVLEVAFGDSIAQAIAEGLRKNLQVFHTVGIAIAQSMVKGFKAETEIASPSKLFARLGMDVVRGLENGLKGVVQLGADLAAGFANGFKSAIGGVISKLRDVVFHQFRDLTTRMGQDFRNFARDLQQTGLNMVTSGGFAAFMQSQAVQMAATFEQTMNQIRVFGNLTKTELENVQNAILDFSAKTIFDPQQSAAAFLDLQKAGLSAAEALQVLTHVGNLAAAGNMDLAEATRGAISAIQIFGLGMEDAGRVADGFVQAANKSTASVSELIQGIGNIGPLAQEFGISFEETLAILAQFNDAGIRGAEAGTQLRSMLTNITKPTAQVQGLLDSLGVSLTDANGNFRSMSDIIRDLSGAMHDGTRTQEENFQTINKLAGTYGQMGLAVLLAGENIDSYVASMKQLPGSALIAQEMMATFAGRIDSLKGSVQTLMFKALIPLMQKVLAPLFDKLVEFVNLIASLPSDLLAFGAGIILVGTAMFTLLGAGLLLVGSVLMPLGLALTGLSGILTVVGALLFNPLGLIAGFAALGGAAALLIGFFGGIIAALTGIVALIHTFSKAMKNSGRVTADFRLLKAAVNDLFRAFKPLVESVFELIKNLFGIAEASATSEDQFAGYSKVLRNFAMFVMKISDGVRELTEMIGILNLLMRGGGEAELAELGSRIRDFSQTGLATNLFGGGEQATTQGILEKLQKIAKVMQGLGDLVSRFTAGVLGFLSGEIGFGQVIDAILGVLGKAAGLFVQAGSFVGGFILDGIVGALRGLRDLISNFLEEGFDQIGKIINVSDLGSDVKEIFEDIFGDEGLQDLLEILMGLEKTFRPVISEMIDSWQSWAIGIATVRTSLYLLAKGPGVKVAIASLLIILKTVVTVVAAALAFEAAVLALGGTIRSIVSGDFNILARTMRGIVSQFDYLVKLLDVLGFDGLAKALNDALNDAKDFFKQDGEFATFLNSLFGFGGPSPSSPIVKAIVEFLKEAFETAVQLFKDLWLAARGKILMEDVMQNLLGGISDITGIPFAKLIKAFEDLKQLVKDNFLVVAAVIGAFLKFIFDAFSFRFITYLYQPLLLGFRLLIRITTTFKAFGGALTGLVANLALFIVIAYGIQGALEGLINAGEGILKIFEGFKEDNPTKIMEGLKETLAGLTQAAAGFLRNVFHLFESIAKFLGLDFLVKPLKSIREFFEQFTTEAARLRFIQAYGELFKTLGENIREFLTSVGNSSAFQKFVAILAIVGMRIREFVEELLPKIGPFLREGFGKFLSGLVTISETLRSVFEGVFNAIKDTINGIIGFFTSGTGGDLAQLIIVPLKLVWTILKLLFTIVTGLVKLFQKFADAVGGSGKALFLLWAAATAIKVVALVGTGALLPSLAIGLAVFTALTLTVYGLIGAFKGLLFALSGVGVVLEGVNEILKGNFAEGGRLIVEGLIKIGLGIVSAIAGFILNVAEAVAKGLQFIGDKLGIQWLEDLATRALAAIGQLKELLSFDVLEGVAEGLADRFMGLVGIFGELIKAIKDNLNFETLKTIGGFLIDGLWWGIENALNLLTFGLWDVFKEKLLDPFLEALGIQSPSTLFMQYGDDIIQGLINGINIALTLLEAAATGLINFLKDQFTFDNLVNAMAVGLKIARSIADAFDWAVDQFFNIVDSLPLGELVQGAVDGLFDFLDDLPSPTAIFDAVKGIFDKIIEAVRGIDLSFFTEAVNTVEEGFNKVKNFLGGGDDSSEPMTPQTSALSTMLASLNNITLDSTTRDSVMRLGENLIIAVTSGMGSAASKAAIEAVGLTMAGLFIEGVQKGLKMTGLVALIGQIWSLAILKGMVTPGVLMAVNATASQFANEFIDRVKSVFGITGTISLKGQAIGSAFISGIAVGFTQSAGAIIAAVLGIASVLGPAMINFSGIFAAAGGIIIGTLAGITGAMNSAWSAANNLATALRNLSGINVSIPNLNNYTPQTYSTPSTSSIMSSISSGISSVLSTGGSYTSGGKTKNYNPNYKIPQYAEGGRPQVGKLAEVAEGGVGELFRTDSGKTYFIPGESGTIVPFERGGYGGMTGFTRDEKNSLFRQLQAPRSSVNVQNDNSQNIEVVVQAPLGEYSRQEIKTLFEEAWNKSGRDRNQYDTGSMDIKRQMLLGGRR